MRLKKSFIETEQELQIFSASVKRLLDIEFPREYFERSKVRIFKNHENKIVGGYALVMEGPFRTLESIPSEAKAKLPNQDQVLEVTALWLDPSIRSGASSVAFWLNFSRDLASFKNKKQYVYAYDLEKTGLSALYQLAKPEVIYQGLTKQLPGMKSQGEESIEVASCARARFLPLLAFPNLLCKLLFKRRTHFKKLRYVQAILRSL